MPIKKITVSAAMKPGIERRGHPRLPLDLICHVHSRNAKTWKVSGRTVNVSRSGVLVRLPAFAPHQAPQLGSAVRVDIELPTRRLLRCHGRLVRVVNSQQEGPLMALAVQRMEFRESLRKPAVTVGRERWSEVKELLM